MTRLGFAYLCLLGSSFLGLEAAAQPLPPPAEAPAPEQGPAPIDAPAAGTETIPAPAPPADPAASYSAETSAQASAELGPVGQPSLRVAPHDAAEEDREFRRLSLRIQNSLSGSTGLLRIVEAGSGAPGTFRMSLIGSYFRGDEFLCSDSDCPALEAGENGADEVSRVGVHVGLSATVLPFLEASFGFHSYATSNDRGDPELLQALGDTNLGVKAFMPHEPDRLFSFGAEAQLLLLNGTGSVGLDGSGTSLALRALGTVDLQNRRDPSERIPLRLHANLGYLLNNSGELVADAEQRRNARI